MSADGKRVYDYMAKSASVSDIINDHSILFNDMFREVLKLNHEFNRLKRESRFIWHSTHPNFLNLTIIPSNGMEHSFSMSASIRECDELLNVAAVYIMPEYDAETYHQNPLLIKFLEIYREQLFRIILEMNNYCLITTKREYMNYCPNIPKDELLRLFHKYHIPKGDDVEWDPKEQCYRSLQQIIREEKEEE